jgi:hypothetical protein
MDGILNPARADAEVDPDPRQIHPMATSAPLIHKSTPPVQANVTVGYAQFNREIATKKGRFIDA